MARKSNTLIVGFGEIGSSLHTVLKKTYPVWAIDPVKKIKQSPIPEKIDVMHVCFPPSNHFYMHVKKYQIKYKPKYTVIHSTVPIGTSSKLQAYHSPVRGVHPNIAEGIETFVKYLAPKSEFLTKYFEDAGVPIMEVDKPETTEALKLWDTTYYGWNIIFEKLLHDWCKENKVDYDIVYQHANITYNIGYKALGRTDVQRPVLKHYDGEIGGHCVIPNLRLFKSPIADFLKKHNESYKLSSKKVRKASRKSR